MLEPATPAQSLALEGTPTPPFRFGHRPPRPTRKAVTQALFRAVV